MRGIQVDQIRNFISGSQTSVVNLAHPNYSLPLDRSLIMTMPEINTIETIIVEVQPRSADLRDLELSIDGTLPPVKPPLWFGEINVRFLLSANLKSVNELIHQRTQNSNLASWQALQMVSARISYGFPEIYNIITTQLHERLGPVINDGFSLPYDPSRSQDCNELKWSSPLEEFQGGSQRQKEVKAQYLETFNNWIDVYPLEFFYGSSHVLDRWLIQDIIREAQIRSWTTYFLYTPSLAVPVDPKLSNQFEITFGAPLLIPPSSLREEFADGGHIDHSHLNNRGRKLLTEWVISEIFTDKGEGD